MIEFVNKYIIELFKTDMTVDEIHAVLKLLLNNNTLARRCVPENLLESTNTILAGDYVSKLICYWLYNDSEINTKVPKNNLSASLIKYTNMIALNHVIVSLTQRFGSKEMAGNQIIGYLSENDLSYITESYGNARTIVGKFGVKGLSDIIIQSGYATIDDYIKGNFTNRQKRK